jgi:DNA-binding transcriptional ArsR family regulator
MTTPHRRFKDAIYEQFARLGKAISAPRRLELLDLLCQGPRTVEALAQQAAISVANASQHLQVLRAARLVDAEKKGLTSSTASRTTRSAGSSSRSVG